MLLRYSYILCSFIQKKKKISTWNVLIMIHTLPIYLSDIEIQHYVSNNYTNIHIYEHVGIFINISCDINLIRYLYH